MPTPNINTYVCVLTCFWLAVVFVGEQLQLEFRTRSVGHWLTGWDCSTVGRNAEHSRTAAHTHLQRQVILCFLSLWLGKGKFQMFRRSVGKSFFCWMRQKWMLWALTVVCLCGLCSEDAQSSDGSMGSHLLSAVSWSAGGTLLAAFQNKLINIWTVNGQTSILLSHLHAHTHTHTALLLPNLVCNQMGIQ